MLKVLLLYQNFLSEFIERETFGVSYKNKTDALLLLDYKHSILIGYNATQIHTVLNLSNLLIVNEQR